MNNETEPIKGSSIFNVMVEELSDWIKNAVLRGDRRETARLLQMRLDRIRDADTAFYEEASGESPDNSVFPENEQLK